MLVAPNFEADAMIIDEGTAQECLYLDIKGTPRVQQRPRLCMIRQIGMARPCAIIYDHPRL